MWNTVRNEARTHFAYNFRFRIFFLFLVVEQQTKEKKTHFFLFWCRVRQTRSTSITTETVREWQIVWDREKKKKMRILHTVRWWYIWQFIRCDDTLTEIGMCVCGVWCAIGAAVCAPLHVCVCCVHVRNSFSLLPRWQCRTPAICTHIYVFGMLHTFPNQFQCDANRTQFNSVSIFPFAAAAAAPCEIDMEIVVQLQIALFNWVFFIGVEFL